MRGVLALAFVFVAAGSASASAGIRTLTFSYRAHDGATATAYVVLPSWYGPSRHPTIPLVLSPHGRGVSGSYNLRFWGGLPGRGGFALVSPDGHGRRLPFYSWGYAGQIDDLARMPHLVRGAFPWLRLGRVFAIGDSMGAQESLLLAASGKLHLAGVAAFDSVSDMTARYRMWHVTPGEQKLPAKARIEFGGAPRELPGAYAARSPIAKLAAIARSGIRIQLWWSHRDSVVTDQLRQSEQFYRRLRALGARVQAIVGFWEHAHSFHAGTQLPAALACLGLLDPASVRVPAYERRADGSIEELPPERMLADVRLNAAFCGR